MKIKLTYEGKEQVIDNVSVGGQIKVEYVKSDGEVMVYYMNITDNETCYINNVKKR